jgi:hypothetical protein
VALEEHAAVGDFASHDGLGDVQAESRVGRALELQAVKADAVAHG